MKENKPNSVLIVDDWEINLGILTNILSPDYTVYTATNGTGGIREAEKHLPDVILLDILMPERDGYTVLTALKNSDKTRHIPVIFITGLDNVDNEEKGLVLGAADYITKPFSNSVVKLRVANQIKISNLEKEKKSIAEKLEKDLAAIRWAQEIHGENPEMLDALSEAEKTLERLR
ncbi:MAG: response regulator [Oscillospiraceae bacterium]|nr:response regulator [Oscillospiraceae bacterium]